MTAPPPPSPWPGIAVAVLVAAVLTPLVLIYFGRC